MDRVSQFRSAGRTLFSFGLVKETEGNLSTFDGTTMSITRAGVALNEISDEAMVNGGLDGELPEASSDLEVHRSVYRVRGPGALVHAHPPGTMPEGGGGPGEHGVYVFGPSLQEAAEDAVRRSRQESLEGPGG
jgi:ribulose-5-phosphate 4-epimerase/fuculose-1-phosphate aldolase